MTQKKNRRAAQRRTTSSGGGVGVGIGASSGSQRVGDKRQLPTCSNPFASTSPTNVAADMIFPQPMEIAFSLEAGTFSSDMFETPSTTASLASSPLPNAFVVCFEDVLVPVKWMAHHLGLRPSTKGIQDAKERMVRTPYLHESIARIEQSAMQLLTAISARGPVCILSEQSARFVEAASQAFFPRLAYCLASPHMFVNVQVIGAPKKFETTMERTNWRTHLMQALVRERLFAGSPHLLIDPIAGRFGLIVASPHQVDAMACAKAMEVAPFLVAKSLRVANARTFVSLDQFVAHLNTLGQWLSEAAPCTTAFSVSL